MINRLGRWAMVIGGLMIPVSAWSAGTVSGLISVDDDWGCEIQHGRDTEKLGCSVDRDSRFNLPRITLRFDHYRLESPPICVVSGVPLERATGDAGREGTLPVITSFSSQSVSFVLNGVPLYPCDCGDVALFNCSISD